MCARRFLGCIFFLILIAVAGAFVLYQWGGEVLVRMATPQGHFQAPAKGSSPDYAKVESWIARPGMADNPSLWHPSGVAPEQRTAGMAATFYVHPTTYLAADRWNAPLELDGEAARRTRLFVETQGGTFSGMTDVWAPKYRQAAYGAFLLKSADARQALDLAYRDVLAAFDRFLAAQPADRPLIIAAHSQGSLHALRLLKDRRAVLRGRLVAAYIIGWPVGVSSDLPATGLVPCTAPDQTQCVLSWQSFREPANMKLVTNAWVGTTGLTGAAHRGEDMLCTNPLTGTRDGTAPPSANGGTLVPDGKLAKATVEGGRVGASCRGGFLLIDGEVPDLGPYVLPGNNYHVYDYALFWNPIRTDSGRRLMAWRAR